MKWQAWNEGASVPVLYRCPTCEHDGPRGVMALMQLLDTLPPGETLTCRMCGIVWGPVEHEGMYFTPSQSRSTLAGRG